ncbi:heme o synthase [Phycisphaera mikurensis]|uniref:Protoheme IX farnesyltransferase n=1 Tax=Phycisphaera mikurensis (strain NBRC 102666 / KCTC 22515 / FYK2301M01) TaxID=1142394 RepID=I0IEW6_PHYMF|nr:heme o synthase [Phycisphaera mikurensis]MBB6441599.1 protoheme IX farnesyltransferase [Phycisphaera mikurensis]BAM03804.1 protoheme IX farnesyltransferase [Phycisphaera mikurensis NBRC 102666]
MQAHAASERTRTPAARAVAWSDWVALTKPRITRMVVVTAGLGFLMATLAGATWTWAGLLGTLAGTAASCAAAGVWNQVIEREADARMSRTRSRPVAAGRVSPRDATGFAAVLAVLGQGLLCTFGTPLASALAAATIVLYVGPYTLLKPKTPASLWVGAVPGALPPVIGFAAASAGLAGTPWYGATSAAVWWVFGVMFFWQIPHFLAIAWKLRDDYAAGGLAMLPVVDPGGRRTGRQAVAGAALLLACVLTPAATGTLAVWAAVPCALAAAAYLGLAAAFAKGLDPVATRRLFLASLAVLPLMLALFAVGAL